MNGVGNNEVSGENLNNSALGSIIKNLLFFAAFIPIIVKIPYIWNVWQMSPLESGDSVMWLAIPFVAIFCEFVRRRLGIIAKYPVHNFFIWTFLLLFSIAWLILAFKINASAILLSIAIIALAVDLRFGRGVFSAQIPTFVFAVLASPSVSFWLDYYLHVGLGGATSYLLAKFALAIAFLFIWTFTAFIKCRYPRIVNVFFYACVCSAFLYNRVESQSLPTALPALIDTGKLSADDWICKRVPLSNDDKRFFSGCSSITRASYFNSFTQINLLALIVDKISNIHPVGICLKSAGVEILYSKQIFLNVNGENIQVNEMEVRSDNFKYMVYSWFSTDSISTGDFRKFRMNKFLKEKWRHYQLMVPVDNSDVLSVRAAVSDFIAKFGLSHNFQSQK